MNEILVPESFFNILVFLGQCVGFLFKCHFQLLYFFLFLFFDLKKTPLNIIKQIQHSQNLFKCMYLFLYGLYKFIPEGQVLYFNIFSTLTFFFPVGKLVTSWINKIIFILMAPVANRGRQGTRLASKYNVNTIHCLWRNKMTCLHV